MTTRWEDMTEEDIGRLLKEGVDVIGENKGFQFASSLNNIGE